MRRKLSFCLMLPVMMSGYCLGSQAYALEKAEMFAVVRCNGNSKYRLNEWVREFNLILRDGKGLFVRSGTNKSGRRFKETWDFDTSSSNRITIRVEGKTSGLKTGHNIDFLGKAAIGASVITIFGQQRNGTLITRKCQAKITLSNISFSEYGRKIEGLKRRQVALESRQKTTEVRQANIESRQIANSSDIAVNKQNADRLNKKIGDLQAQISTLKNVLDEQSALKALVPPGEKDSIAETIRSVESRIDVLKKEYSAKNTLFSKYLTSIRPDDRELYLTARKASEIYPRIPYYIPGTKEIGEFWVEPKVSDRGEMVFRFQFVDHQAWVQKVRGTISMSLPEIESVRESLLKARKWSKIAHRSKVRKNYEKRIVCFPSAECPKEGERIDGKSSTEIKFKIYDDGSTASSIQRNKGRFVEVYNVSISSALLLQAYLHHVIREAKLEFKAGTRDKKELDKMFQ